MGENPQKERKKKRSLTFWSLKFHHPSGPGTLPLTYLATTGPEMMNISHCGFSKTRRKEIWARMWHVWVSRYIFLPKEMKAPAHAIVDLITGVPPISKLLVPREHRKIILRGFITFSDDKYSRFSFFKKQTTFQKWMTNKIRILHNLIQQIESLEIIWLKCLLIHKC